MATTVVSLSQEWVLLCPTTKSFVVTCTYPDVVHYVVDLAISDTEQAPNLSAGHTLLPGEGATRDLLGPGYLYWKTRKEPCSIALTSWTP